MMEKVGLPKGLIRYASEDEISKKEPFKFTNRMKGYVAVLAILTGVFIGMLFLRNEVEATILRLPGQLFQHKGDKISNVYTFKIVNKTSNNFEKVHFELRSPKGVVKMVGNQHFKVPREGITEGTLFIEINQAVLESDKTKLILDVYNDNHLIDTETTNFLGPRSFD